MAIGAGVGAGNSRFWRRVAVVALCLFLLALTASSALARMGGGHSYGGGGWSGGGSGGSGGGGDDALIGFLIEIVLRLLIELCIHYPEVGIPLLLCVVGVFIYFQLFGASTSTSVAAVRRSLPPGPPRAALNLQQALESLRKKDPNFSRVLFLDFVRILYIRYHEARGQTSGAPDSLVPFVAGELMGRLLQQRQAQGPLACAAVKDVIVGSSTLQSLTVNDERTVAHVVIVANYTDVAADGSETPYYVEEKMSLRRGANALSQGPDKMRSLHCPGCGSPVQCDERGVCAHCGSPPKPGAAQWELYALQTDRRQHRDAFDAMTPEARRNAPPSPLRLDPHRDAALRDLAARDPQFAMAQFEQRVRYVFDELQRAWSSLQWEDTRPLQTKSLYQANLFWIERYRRRRWANKLDDARIERVFPVKVEHDAFYDTITVRISAEGKDYTLDANGAVISGSREENVKFREYWTFIRRSGFCAAAEDEDEHGGGAGAGDGSGGGAGDGAGGGFSADGGDASHCPNCGAPVDSAASQECPFCGSVIESSEFDWTLAFIDQETAYLG